MNIAVIGSPKRSEELSEILSSKGFEITRLESTKNIHFGNYEVIFDLDFDDRLSGLDDYEQISKDCLIFLSSVKIQLEAVLRVSLRSKVIGINALSTFLNRSALEYCTLIPNFDERVILNLGWQKAYKASSRVGLVSPRVVFMIINEAYFTLQEGTANKQDIDKGMKLGTAYPLGPFEWCEKIGIKDVYETLDALYQDTHDARYKICSMLKTDYLNRII